MKPYRIIEIKEGIFEQNNQKAQALRDELQNNNQLLINIMSSPGSGKTTTLVKTIEHLKSEINIGVMEADIDSDVDAQTIHETGARVIQLHTGGMCHLDAEMTRQGLDALGYDDLDVIFLENVGNLVCPAEFDTGANKNVMILSVPEGDDKPLKYPLMFSIVDVVLLNKMDVAPYFNFDIQLFKERVKKVNPNAEIIEISALNDQGFKPWTDWILKQVKK